MSRSCTKQLSSLAESCVRGNSSKELLSDASTCRLLMWMLDAISSISARLEETDVGVSGLGHSGKGNNFSVVWYFLGFTPITISSWRFCGSSSKSSLSMMSGFKEIKFKHALWKIKRKITIQTNEEFTIPCFICVHCSLRNQWPQGVRHTPIWEQAWPLFCVCMCVCVCVCKLRVLFPWPAEYLSDLNPLSQTSYSITPAFIWSKCYKARKPSLDDQS